MGGAYFVGKVMAVQLKYKSDLLFEIALLYYCMLRFFALWYKYIFSLKRAGDSGKITMMMNFSPHGQTSAAVYNPTLGPREAVRFFQ